MASPDRTTALLQGAGFDEVRVEDVPVVIELPDVDEYLAFMADTAGGLALTLRDLSADARQAVKADAEAVLERFAGPGGYEVQGVALCAVAS